MKLTTAPISLLPILVVLVILVGLVDPASLRPVAAASAQTGAQAQNRISGAPADTVMNAALARVDSLPPPLPPETVLAITGPDTLRTNLQVAEGLMGEAVAAVVQELPAPPAAIVLVPGSTEDDAIVLTNVAAHRLRGAGYEVYLDQRPAASDAPIYEVRYRVQNLELSYPDSGRRFLFWKSWVGRKMDLAVQVTVTDAEGQVLVSRRQAHAYEDRVPAGSMAAVESPTYEFTQLDDTADGGSRRLEQVVVLGSLAALVAIYFANTE